MRRYNHPLVILVASLSYYLSISNAASLFSVQQVSAFPSDTPKSCLSALNATLSCDSTVQLLFRQTDWVGWNATNLTTLCTNSCRSNLVSFKASATSACANWAGGNLGQGKLDIPAMMELALYKYDMTCLSSGTQFCLMQRQSWDIIAMNQSGKITWPKYTNKTYYDWINDPINGTLRTDANGTQIMPFQYPPLDNFQDLNYTAPQKSALDYIYTGGTIQKANFGWPEALESDEYPLEIQCSKCFIDRFTMGYNSSFGSMYTDLTAQVWRNMKANCGLTQTLTVNPILNITGPPPNVTQIITWNAQPVCDRSIQYTEAVSKMTTCQEFSLAQNIPSASLMEMNDVKKCWDIGNGTFCAPLPCQIDIVNYTQGVSALQYLPERRSDLSLIQFMRWNPFARFKDLKYGEVVCVGPPGGAYTPTTTVPPAYPSVYTTTARLALPTASGSIPNCGLWYNVTAGDYCNLVAIRFSLTFDQLVNMNPSLDSVCSNLALGVNYCVAPVNGTAVSTITAKQPTATSTSIVVSGTAYPAPPAPTRSGTTAQCNTWYTVLNGDTCDAIDQRYGITFSKLVTWNNYVDSTCSNLWPNYAVCVNSPIKLTVTTTSGATSGISTTSQPPTTCISTTTALCYSTPAPIQTGAVAQCNKFYFTVSGDTCSALGTKYGFTVSQFVAWNPAVGSSCNIWLSEWYCIGV